MLVNPRATDMMRRIPAASVLEAAVWVTLVYRGELFQVCRGTSYGCVM